MQDMVGSIAHSKWVGYLAAVLGTVAVSASSMPFRGQLDDTIVALAMLLVVLCVATLWGRGPGIVAAVLGTLGYDFFLSPALATASDFTLAHPQHWSALAAFLITASAAGHLSITARRRAAEAKAERQTTAELTAAHKRERDISCTIQQMLLLDRPPMDIPGLRVAALTLPSQQVDGDFYYFYQHTDQCLDLIVADVMGKGIPAALLGAATKSHFLEALCHLLAMSHNGTLPEPQEIVTLANADMVRQLINLESFVTLCYARVDLATQRLDLVDCGHTGVMHLHAKTGLCDTVHGDNLPLGIRTGERFSQIAVPFEPADILLFYSDGVTETRNPAGELFGVERLESWMRTNRDLEPQGLVESIRQAVCAFAASDQLTDDLTCVAIKVGARPLPRRRATLEIRSDLKELRRAREFVRAVCRDLPGTPFDADSVAAFELAVNEAASNIMKHAYHGRTDRWISLEAEVSPTHPAQVSIWLHHLGDPFDPSTVRPPALDGSQESGFGVYLITQSVNDVRYYCDARGRNCIALVKSPQASA